MSAPSGLTAARRLPAWHPIPSKNLVADLEGPWKNTLGANEQSS